MPTLSSLKASMVVTMIVVPLVLVIFLVIVDTILFFFGITFCNFYMLLLFALAFILLQLFIGPWLVKRSAKIDEAAIERGANNRFLQDTVRELTAKAEVPMPTVVVIPDPEPNAFVFGVWKDEMWLVVHEGLLTSLNKDEIEGVLAHEVGHIKHKDCLVMTIISAIPLMMYIIARAGFEVLKGRVRVRGKAALALLIFLLIAAISYLIYLIAQAFVLHLSRSREYFADDYSAELTGAPWKLSSGLVKIMTGLSLESDHAHPNGLRAFYVGDPVKAPRDAVRYRERVDEYDLDGNGVIDEQELETAMQKESTNPWRKANDLFSTHPSIYKRILVLRKIELEMDTTVVSVIDE
jgi:heat shock protein HtpX